MFTKKIKLTAQGIKEEKHSNSYNSVYKLISNCSNFRKEEDESWDKFLNCFLDPSSSLKISGIDLTTHSHLICMENENLMSEDPNKNTTLQDSFS